MNQYVKSYAIFLAMMVATKVVVAPILKNMNVPYLSDL